MTATIPEEEFMVSNLGQLLAASLKVAEGTMGFLIVLDGKSGYTGAAMKCATSEYPTMIHNLERIAKDLRKELVRRTLEDAAGKEETEADESPEDPEA